ncbi:MAG: site-2 protease family protein, partial [Candidatus Omnitrophica bacterium]|nr:site-2 protease family protein [Candidatus Omnitrophota bacterium]
MIPALISLVILGLLVIVHELGHFLVARWSGVRILRFSIGFGPRLFTWTRGHTEYAISAIPLGGYVKMAGEQDATRTQEPWEYLSRPIRARARIIFAGPLVNYLVALISLWVVFIVGYPELLPVVGKVLEDTPAQAAGLQSGDRILSVDG